MTTSRCCGSTGNRRLRRPPAGKLCAGMRPSREGQTLLRAYLGALRCSQSVWGRHEPVQVAPAHVRSIGTWGRLVGAQGRCKRPRPRASNAALKLRLGTSLDHARWHSPGQALVYGTGSAGVPGRPVHELRVHAGGHASQTAAPDRLLSRTHGLCGETPACGHYRFMRSSKRARDG